MSNVRVPLTNIATPQFITVRLAVPQKDRPVASTVPFFNSTTITIIGAAKGITKLGRQQTRNVERIYGFNGNEFEPVWVVPGQIETNISLSQIVFHSVDTLSSFGYTRGSIFFQDRPFILIEDQYALNQSVSNVVTDALGALTNTNIKSEPEVTLARSIHYMDCWITDGPIDYDIMADDMILMPDIKIACGKVLSSEQEATTFLQSTVYNTVLKGLKI